MVNEDDFGLDFGFDFWEGFGSNTSNAPATLEEFTNGGSQSQTDYDYDDDGMATYDPPDPWGIVDRY